MARKKSGTAKGARRVVSAPRTASSRAPFTAWEPDRFLEEQPEAPKAKKIEVQ